MTKNAAVKRRALNSHKDGSSHAKKHKKQTQPFWALLMKPSNTLFAFAVAVISIVAGVAGYYWYDHYLVWRVTAKLDASRIMAYTKLEDSPIEQELYWGSYRPHVYFGMKTRSSHPVVAGLLWYKQFIDSQPKVRHWCDQGDNLKSYGWTKHDGRNFGVQDIVDGNVKLRTEFVKHPGGDHGGDWGARVSATLLDNKPTVISLAFYIAIDTNAAQLASRGVLNSMIDNLGISIVSGDTPGTGTFKMRLERPQSNLLKTDYLIATVASLDAVTRLFQNGMVAKTFRAAVAGFKSPQSVQYVGLQGRVVPPNEIPNIVIQQFTCSVPCSFEVSLESGSFNDRPYESLTGQVFEQQLQKHIKVFDERFEARFGLSEKNYSAGQIGFGQAALSNLLGGIGYFSGRSVVTSSRHKQPVLGWHASLYTAVPSRPFFPRGFLWDEGFHNLAIHYWDPAISRQIIGHWLDLLNKDGWIPREQILGDEARAKVPAEFLVQHNENANPPSLFLVARQLVDALDKVKPAEAYYLKALFHRLAVWYEWFNTTQLGSGGEPSAYRWRGRNPHTLRELNPKTLTSGLDDYPRASHPSDDERHLDLRCWMALGAAVLARLADKLELPRPTVMLYESTRAHLSDQALLDRLHWSEARQRYVDFGLHTDDVALRQPPPPQLAPGQRPPPNYRPEMIRVLVPGGQQPRPGLVHSTFGYVSLFPLLLRLLPPDSPRLPRLLDDLASPRLLWTRYGLRSLSADSPLYGRRNTEHDPPYWRGAVWVNMNYLALGALRHYSREATGEAAAAAGRLFGELKRNLVHNLYSEYRRTGYLWEQYDDRSGRGRGSHPFTGWSSLGLLIMADVYDY